jgi:hypothetical protein
MNPMELALYRTIQEARKLLEPIDDVISLPLLSKIDRAKQVLDFAIEKYGEEAK